MCTVLLPPGVNPIAVNKIYHINSIALRPVRSMYGCLLTWSEGVGWMLGRWKVSPMTFVYYFIYVFIYLFTYLFWCDSPQWARASSFTRFLDHTQRRTTVGRTPLDEWSARRRDLYPTTHNTHNRQTSMPPVAFEPIISAGERPQIHALERAAIGTGFF